MHCCLAMDCAFQIELMNATVVVVIVGDERNITLSWTTPFPPVLLTDQLDVTDQQKCNSFGRVAFPGMRYTTRYDIITSFTVYVRSKA